MKRQIVGIASEQYELKYYYSTQKLEKGKMYLATFNNQKIEEPIKVLDILPDDYQAHAIHTITEVKEI